jgi:hypothetical protein
MEIIEADADSTWPRELRDALLRNEEEISAYQAMRAQIDRAAQADVSLRINRPHNPGQIVWDSVLENAADAVRGKPLLGFHATRLTQLEQDTVQRHGLRVLSDAFLVERLEASRAAGDLPDHIVSKLLVQHQASECNRSGMLWFSFTQEQLGDEGSVSRFFRSWGGEALYNNNEDHPETGPALAMIGQPCLILAAVPIDEVEAFSAVGERLVNVWCETRNIRTGNGRSFEGYIRHNISGSAIRDIIKPGDPRFGELTGHTKWRDPLRLR